MSTQDAIEPDKYIKYENNLKEGGHVLGHNNFVCEEYDKQYQWGVDDPAGFWADKAKDVHWFKQYDQVLQADDMRFPKWFVGGQINICYNAIDRHIVAGRGDHAAIHYESSYTDNSGTLTYNELRDKVGRLAAVMKNKFGVKAGDRVLIYMPMIPETAIAALACARIGATHALVFGGFAAPEVANRIDGCQPKLILTASMGIEPTKKIDYLQVINESLKLCQKYPNAEEIPKLFFDRPELDGQLRAAKTYTEDSTYFDMAQEMAKETEVAPAEKLDANHPLYILYTSGTTGDPKGMVRDHGGTTVALNYAFNVTYDFHPGKNFFAAADLGWIVGHSCILYGALVRGTSTVIYEGKPTVPDAGVLWRLIEKYKIHNFFLAPTATRELMRVDFNGEFIKKYDVSSLQVISMAGERTDPESIKWLRRNFPRTIINDNWWQTETGYPIGSKLVNQDIFGAPYPTLVGSCTKAIPGWNLEILDENNEPVPRNTLGRVCLKQPMPPCHTMTIWGNDNSYIEKYMADVPGYYLSGDEGIIDERGYLTILSRIDDVINVAGHRLDTGRLEESINTHDLIVESAVVGLNDKMKGEVPIAIVIMRSLGDQVVTDEAKQMIANELNFAIRNEVGPWARLEGAIFIDRLPKTRSGKILRKVMKQILNDENYKEPATIDDPATLEVIKALSLSKGYEQAAFKPDQRWKPQ